MCGICGFVRTEPYQVHEDTASLQRMCDTIAHRGPDAEGYRVFDERIFLGHRRLSIIDLSRQGHQPMSNEDGSVWVIYNGEIYNFVALRAELQAKGHTFRSKSDTEVLVHLYEELGPAMLERLNGMFAFALWDARKKRLFCARDAVGIKPFYYIHRDDGIAFASEIKALLALPNVEAQLDRLAFWQSLSFRYVPGERTVFAGIKKLLPGHCFTWQEGQFVMRRFRFGSTAGYSKQK